MFKPLRDNEESLQEQVATAIKNAIVNEELKPGDKLPPERDLAEMLKVSRGSLREALNHLHAAGLVYKKHGVGVFIRNTDPDAIVAGFAKQLRPDEKKLQELFEIRQLIETRSAAWAAERGTPDKIKELQELVYSVKDRINEVETGQLTLLANQDTKFHLLIAEATDNSIVLETMNNLLDVLAESRAKALTTPGRAYKSLNEHIEIIEGIAKRDAGAAQKAMSKHLQGVENDIIHWYYNKTQQKTSS